MQIDQQAEVSDYVQRALLQWINSYPAFQQTRKLSQLSDGKFFLCILQSLPNFRLINSMEPIQEGEQLNLGTRVSVIKNISRSLIKYHQTLLLRDVSDLEINYVELCMGNLKELFRLITMLFSALYSQPASRKALQQQILKLPQDKHQVLSILLQNSQKIGQQHPGTSSVRSWRQSEQKKILDKMQSLEDKIQQLQIVNKQLQQRVKNAQQVQQSLACENRRLRDEMKALFSLNQELVEKNQKLGDQIGIFRVEQTTYKKKIQVVKTHLQQKLQKQQQQIQRLQKQSQQSFGIRERIHTITQINKEIKEQNENLRDVIAKLQSQRLQNKRMQREQNQEYIRLKRYCGELEVKIEELTVMESYNDRTCYFGAEFHGQRVDCSDENAYRIKQNLNWMNNNSHYATQINNNSRLYASKQNHLSSESQLEGGDLAIIQKYQSSHDNQFEIKTITERSLQSSLGGCLDKIKENQSIIMEYSELPRLQNQNRQKDNRKNNKQDGAQANDCLQQYSAKYLEMQGRYTQQIKILTCVILDLQSQLQEMRKQQPITIAAKDGTANNSMSESRMHKFKAKVREMFEKKMESSVGCLSLQGQGKLSREKEVRSIR